MIKKAMCNSITEVLELMKETPLQQVAQIMENKLTDIDEANLMLLAGTLGMLVMTSQDEYMTGLKVIKDGDSDRTEITYTPISLSVKLKITVMKHERTYYYVELTH